MVAWCIYSPKHCFTFETLTLPLQTSNDVNEILWQLSKLLRSWWLQELIGHQTYQPGGSNQSNVGLFLICLHPDLATNDSEQQKNGLCWHSNEKLPINFSLLQSCLLIQFGRCFIISTQMTEIKDNVWNWSLTTKLTVDQSLEEAFQLLTQQLWVRSWAFEGDAESVNDA